MYKAVRAHRLQHSLLSEVPEQRPELPRFIRYRHVVSRISVKRQTVLHILQYPAINPLTPNDPYRGRTAPLTSKRCILYIYSTNIGTEYFKHGTYSAFFSLQNAVWFINLMYLVPVLFTFYIFIQQI